MHLQIFMQWLPSKVIVYKSATPQVLHPCSIAGNQKKKLKNNNELKSITTTETFTEAIATANPVDEAAASAYCQFGRTH